MSEITDQIKAQKAALAAQARREALAFQEVFGQEKTRSSSQKIVIESLKAQCGQDVPCNLLDQEGRIDPSSAVFFEGSRRIYLFIEGRLRAALGK